MFGVHLEILEQSAHGAIVCIGVVIVDGQLA